MDDPSRYCEDMTYSPSGWATPGSNAPAVPSTLRPNQQPLPRSNMQGATSYPPSAQPPQRPTYREPHRAKPISILGGAGVAILWFVVTALLGVNLMSTMWVMLIAGFIAVGGSVVLSRYGDRGAAAGIAAVTGAAFAVVGVVVEWHALGGSWILW